MTSLISGKTKIWQSYDSLAVEQVKWACGAKLQCDLEIPEFVRLGPDIQFFTTYETM